MDSGETAVLAAKVARSPLLRRAQASVTRSMLTTDRVLARRTFWFASVLALFALQIALIVTHEPWLDEYQAVQLAVQSPDIGTLFDWLRYEGHPPLWYLILRGLAHCMEPLLTLKVAALMCAAIT